MLILSSDEILKLHAAVVSSRMPPHRSALLVGIDPAFTARLPESAAPSDQILSDLHFLNSVGMLADHSVPLGIWLKNAIALSQGREEVAEFETALSSVERYLDRPTDPPDPEFETIGKPPTRPPFPPGMNLIRRILTILTSPFSRLFSNFSYALFRFYSSFVTLISIRLVLDGELDALEHETIERSIAELRRLTSDSSLRLQTITQGSVVLVLEGSGRGYRALRDTFKKGQLPTICGLRLVDIRPARITSVQLPKESADAPVVMICYDQKDSYWRDRVRDHLRLLQVQGKIRVWDDLSVPAGEDLVFEATEVSASAAAAVLLITASYLGSSDRHDEAISFLERRDGSQLHVFPLLIRPCAWKEVSWLNDVTVLPRDGRALASMRVPRADEALTSFVVELASVLRQWMPNTLVQPGAKMSPPPSASRRTGRREKPNVP